MPKCVIMDCLKQTGDLKPKEMSFIFDDMKFLFQYQTKYGSVDFDKFIKDQD